jgi:hypothetical protein
MFPVLSLEMPDEARQHLLDLVVARAQAGMLVVRQVSSASRDRQVRSRFAAFSSRPVQELREVAVGALREAICDQRRHGGRGVTELIAQAWIASEFTASQEGRNFMRQLKRSLINLQFFDAFGRHADGERRNGARQSLVGSR